MTTVLGIDIGTASSKGVLVDDTGTLLATAVRSHTVDMPRPGWFEQDGEVWWHEVAEIARELLHGRDAPAAVCVSGMGPCALVTDEEGRPRRPGILYGVDTRAETEILELNAEFGTDRILERCGSPLTSQSVGPKLRWLARHEPSAVEPAYRLLMPASLAVLRLTGEYVLDHHSASQCQPMYNLTTAAWDSTWAQQVAPGLELPRLLWPTELAGTVTTEASTQTGIPAGTPVAAGTIDAWAEAVSVGVRDDGDMMLMYGSTMFLIALTQAPRPDAHLWLTQWVSPERRSRAAGLATSGLVTEWFATVVSADLPQLAAEAEASPPGAAGLVALPYFAGERTPLFDPHARGAILGLQLGHTRGDIFRSLLESTAFAVRHNIEAMTAAGDAIERIVAVGGGTRMPMWMSVVSDITGLPQDIPQHTIGASFGDAFMAAICAGVADPAANWNPVDRRIEPRAERRSVYDELYPLYRNLYTDTAPAAHALATLQEVAGGG